MIKNAGPLLLGAGRLLGCWRMVWVALVAAGGCLPFWGPERQGGRPRRRGDGMPGMAVAGNVPAAICGGNSAVFNQQLTTFLVIAMVWWLSVFFLCSYWQFRRRWRLFRSPGAGRWLADGLGGLRVGGMGAVGCQNRKGEG